MHQYLKAIGFDHLKTKKDLKEVLRDTKENFTSHEETANIEGEIVCEYKKEYSEAMGIIMCGDYDGEEFEMEYYFPYLKEVVLLLMKISLWKREWTETCT